MNLSFASPIYLLGLLGITIPILIHLLTRRQQKHIKFSAVYLLLRSQKRSIKKASPNRLLLLLIRCLGIALLSLALANPIFSFGAVEDLVSSKSAANVFLVDDSFSMATRVGESTRYAVAVKTLLQIIDKLPAGSDYSLVQASTPGRVLVDWTRDPKMARKILAASETSFRTTAIGQGMSVALDLLQASSQKHKRIFILTDLEKNGWEEIDFQELKKNSSYAVKILDFSGAENEVNQAAVADTKVFQEFLTNSRIIRVKAGILNLSQQKSLNRLPASLWVNGKKKTEGFAKVSPAEAAEKEFSFPYLENEPIDGVVKIGDDPLLTDNARHFTFEPDQNIRVLVVDGDPKTVAHQSESFYLENALNPFSVALSNILPTVSTLKELSMRNLFDFSVVILSNVRELPFDYNRQLENFVRRGGALFISLGDQIDPKYYNEKLGNLLPVTLESLHQVGKENEPFRLNLESREHPVLKIFKGKTLREMREIRFNALYKVNPRPDRSFKVPVWFKNKYPAIVESELGNGRVILYVSTLDRDWNNFPIQPTFLPWIQRWIKYAVRGLDTIKQQGLMVGDAFLWKEETAGERIYIRTPGRNIRLLEMKNGEGTFEETHRPGVYRVFREPAIGKNSTGSAQTLVKLPSNAVAAGAFTVNVDTRESYPEKISEEEIRILLGEMRVEFSSREDMLDPSKSNKGHPLITSLLLLAAGMMLWEGWLVKRE